MTPSANFWTEPLIEDLRAGKCFPYFSIGVPEDCRIVVTSLPSSNTKEQHG
jgi:hypothetical protein